MTKMISTCGNASRAAGVLLAVVLAAFTTSRCQAAEVPGAGHRIGIRVDPRVELFSIIFRLAGNPEYNQGRVGSYTDDVERHFGGHRDHPAIRLARRLRSTNGVSYDAVMSLAVHVTDAYDLKEKVPFEPRPASLEGRWSVAAAREFLDKARHFVTETGFAEFIEKHERLYELAGARMQEVFQREAHLEWFDEFFGTRPGAEFTVALGMLNGGQCYGPRVVKADGTEELYCVLGVWMTDDRGQPTFDRTVVGTVMHEFCHSYGNPLVDKYEAELAEAGEKMYPYVEAAMKRQAYGNWKTMMYESLVRACVVRYLRAYGEQGAARKAIRDDRERQFLWIDKLSRLLGEYERRRDRYQTLDAFFPEVIAFFNDYAEEFARKRQARDAKAPKVVSIDPANGAQNVNPNLEAIKITFDRRMQDGSWSVVGGGPNFPEISGRLSYDAAKKVLTIPVRLKPDWTYEFWLNSERYQNFRSQKGVPLEPVHVTFTTGEHR